MSNINYKDSPLAKNRAEELGYDLWERFVIPPFYDRLDLVKARKPRVVIGGRGCGKTMLLRYLSHQTMFSKSRKEIPSDDISHIGLYWRVDTQFVSLMFKRNKDEEEWRAAFEHMTSLIIGLEILKSLESIAESTFEMIKQDSIYKVDFSGLRNFDSALPSTFLDLKKLLLEKLWQFESWLNNIQKTESPIFLPKRFLEAVVEIIKGQIPLLKESNFFVYLDEYENLLPYQQRIINTWLKHSEVPLIFNLAMKRNAFKERSTIGNESLSDIHDYRQYDLEVFYEDESVFEVFAAEILILRLSEYGLDNAPINVSDLRDIDKVKDRSDSDYKKRVLEFAKGLFPAITRKELAEEILRDPLLANRVKTQINVALEKRNSSLKAEDFFLHQYPEAIIIIPALLNREKLRPEEIIQELQKLITNSTNKFSGNGGWIHNNFFGCVLLIYEPLNRVCPFYAGFRTFCKMSHGNIRHLIELCHKSITKTNIDGSTEFGKLRISYKNQAEAALQASTAFLGEIKTFGKHGNRLHAFVLRLGTLFHQAHKRPSQSEPEQNHFSIVKGARGLSQEQLNILAESIKWSVLFEEKATKQKSSSQLESTEYVLNPIYAPYFHISYRKKRKLELKTDEFISLIEGEVQEFEAILRKYIKLWEVDIKDSPLTLFSDLNLDD